MKNLRAQSMIEKTCVERPPVNDSMALPCNAGRKRFPSSLGRFDEAADALAMLDLARARAQSFVEGEDQPHGVDPPLHRKLLLEAEVCGGNDLPA